MITFRQYLQKKNYNLYRNFKEKVFFSVIDVLVMVDEWENEQRKELKEKVKQLKKEG